MAMEINTPITEERIAKLMIGDMVYISGGILCGRDVVLPKVVQMIRENENFDRGIELKGSVIFHTAVSPVGVGPTSSNKLEIESSIGPLSKAGAKLHLGKGEIGRGTIEALNQNHAICAVIPLVTALLGDKTRGQELVAFPGLGMETLYRLKVKWYPVIIAAAHGRGIYEQYV